jgi:hypothetical protein
LNGKNSGIIQLFINIKKKNPKILSRLNNNNKETLGMTIKPAKPKLTNLHNKGNSTVHDKFEFTTWPLD